MPYSTKAQISLPDPTLSDDWKAWARRLLLELNKFFVSQNFSLGSEAVYDPANLADGAGATTTVTVPGAMLGNFADASFSLDLQGVLLTAWVSAIDTVSVRFQNETGGAVDLASGTLRVSVRKY